MQNTPTVFQIIFTVLCSVSGYTFILSRKGIDIIEEALTSIYDEFKYQFVQHSNLLQSAIIQENQLEDSIERIRKIIVCSIIDIVKIYKIKRLIIFLCVTSIIGFVSAISITVLPYIYSSFDKWNFLFVRGIQFYIFLFEVIIAVKMWMIENTLKEVKRKYKLREY